MSRIIADTLDLPSQPNIYNRVDPQLSGPFGSFNQGHVGDWTYLGDFGKIESSVSVYDCPFGLFTRFATYVELLFILRDFTNITNTVNIDARFSTDNGATFITSYRRVLYKRSTSGDNLRAQNQAASRIEIMNAASNDVWSRTNAWIHIIKMGWDGDAAILHRGIGWNSGITTPAFMQQIGLATHNAGITNYLRIDASSGNLDGGQVFVYGRKQGYWQRGAQYLGGAQR